MELKELRKRVRFWKRELNLTGWTIRLKICKEEDLPQSHANAEIRADHDAAKLYIWPDSQHVEYWLVHELLHLVLAGIAPDEPNPNPLEENAINRLCRALCRAHSIPCPPFEAL